MLLETLAVEWNNIHSIAHTVYSYAREYYLPTNLEYQMVVCWYVVMVIELVSLGGMQESLESSAFMTIKSTSTTSPALSNFIPRSWVHKQHHNILFSN